MVNMPVLFFSMLIACMPATYNREQVRFSLPQVVMVNGGCSGFIADFGFVVTARHCVDKEIGFDPSVASIKFYDGMLSHFKVAKIGPDMQEHDFAVLQGDTRGIEPMRMSESYPPQGSLCAHIGHGGASPQQLGVYCYVEGYHYFGQESGYIELASNAIPGDSGSMVFNKKYEVFGILTRSAFPIPVALVVPISLAKSALKSIKTLK